MNRYISFRIERPEGDNGFLGRVCGDAIKKGDYFSMLYNLKAHMTPEDDLWGELTEDHRIELTARKIVYWRREFEQIDTGMVCLIEFDGETSGIESGQIIGDEFTLQKHDEETVRFWDRLQQESELGEGGKASPATS